MVQVESVRNSILYTRSLELTFEVYQFLERNMNCFYSWDANKLRQLAISIPKMIACAIGQVNINRCFKLLNEVKDQLLPLLKSLKHKLIKIHRLCEREGEKIDDYSIQILKLIKAYLARKSKDKKGKLD